MTQSRYETGKIYKLVNSVDDKIYVGSTCLPLCKRLYNHKKQARHKPRPVHRHLNTIGWDNVRIILIENVIAETKDQLLMREQHYIDELKPKLNKHAAYARCPHGRQHCECLECHGTSICEHNRVKSKCVECRGVSICKHNRQEQSCFDCRGVSICEHNKHKQYCVLCNGGSICEHNKRKDNCKQCNQDRYKCHICNYVAGSASNLNMHYRSLKHNKKIYSFQNYIDNFLNPA
jgi:group I intron endonuclease